MNENLKAFEADLDRIYRNPIFFLDEYWNKLHPEMRLDLTDEEKEEVFRKCRGAIPFFKDGAVMHEFVEKVEEMRKDGKKDWEIF